MVLLDVKMYEAFSIGTSLYRDGVFEGKFAA